MQADSTAVTPPDPATTATSALNELIAKLMGWFEGFVLALPNLLIAVIVVVLSVLAARLARRFVTGALERLTERVEHARNVVKLLGTLAYVAVLAAGTFIALGILNLDSVVTSLLAGVGVIGLALGFAFQDIASNFIAGVLMAVRNPFTVGQIIETNGHMETVQEITLRSTIIRSFQGQTVILPNAKVFQEAIINYSALRERRVDLAVGVGYGDDLDAAERSAVTAIEALDARKNDRPVQLYYTEFGDSSINLVVRFWVDFAKQTDFLQAQSDAIKAVKAAFDRDGVTIPFPIRTLDFDPNGGLALADAMPRGGMGAGA